MGGTYVGAQKKIEKGIHDYLREQGHESYILYAIGEADDENIICYETGFHNFLRRFLRKVFGKNPHFAILVTLRLLKYIKKIKPDVVHIHVIHNGYVDFVLLLNYLARKHIPVVYTVHDMWAFTGGCYYYTNIECDGYKTGCLNCEKKQEELDCNRNRTSYYFLKKLELFDRLDKLRFVPVSSWVYEEMSKSKLSDYPISTVWNAIDFRDCLSKKGIEKKDRKFTIIGVAANWDDRKGIYRFMEMANELGQEYQVFLVGRVDETIKTIAPPNMTFMGTITDKHKLYELYAMSDVHVSMSFEETFGLTFIEAALSGIKSIGFDSTAIPEVLEKTFGYVIGTNQVAGVVEKIKELGKNREVCQLSEYETEKVKERFSSQRMAREYLDIYNEIL